MRRLRDPERGCPWDVEQTFATIAPYTIEEAYEVADAILREDWDALPGELGDLLLQVVYHARMGEERGWFDFDRVARRDRRQDGRAPPARVRRGGGRGSAALRASGRSARRESAPPGPSGRGGDASLLADVPLGLPALTRAVKLQKRAARAGFDWTGARPVLAKLREELAELEAALAEGRRPGGTELELGDPPVHRGEPRPAPGARPRGGLAGHQRQVRAALPADRGRGRHPGSAGRRADLGRARGAVGAGQGRGAGDRSRARRSRLGRHPRDDGGDEGNNQDARGICSARCGGGAGPHHVRGARRVGRRRGARGRPRRPHQDLHDGAAPRAAGRRHDRGAARRDLSAADDLPRGAVPALLRAWRWRRARTSRS